MKMGDDNDKTTPPETSVDDEEDETFKERLWGLTEMFPEEFVDKVVCTVEIGTNILVRTYKFCRMTTWIIVTSALILLAPIYFECTRLAYERSQHDQFGPCVSSKHSKGRKPGSHPCQPFRPQPQQKEQQ